MRFMCCLNMVFNLTKPKLGPDCLHAVTWESIAALTVISRMLLFTKTLHASMTLWRRSDVRKFDDDAILVEKSSVSKGIFQCLSDIFSAV